MKLRLETIAFHLLELLMICRYKLKDVRRFDSPAFVVLNHWLICQETNAEGHWRMFSLKNHPSHIEDLCIVLADQISPLPFYC